MPTMNSYWCYSCRRFVRISPSDNISCPHCSGGFLEQMSAPPPANRPSGEVLARRRLPTAELRRHRRASASSSDRSSFNPVIVLRRTRPDNTATNSFELYYDDGAGSGLRPLPDSMSDFLMGSGFEQLLDQLAQIEANGLGRAYENPPASKSAIESMPTLIITSQLVVLDSHCAVCKEPFEFGAEAREMPCKHIYHQDCILPWLSIRNSCPVCRHEMPTDVIRRGSSTGDLTGEDAGNEDEMVALTIWRLPGGGFAVGRFSGARRGNGSERELPVVYTEVDGGFNDRGAPRRVSWASRGSRSRERSGFGRLFQRIFGCFSPNSSSSGADVSPPSSTSSTRNQRSSSVFSRSSRSMRWEMENRDADSIAR